MAHAWKACWVQALGGSNPPSSAGVWPRNRNEKRFRGFLAPTPCVNIGRSVGGSPGLVGAPGFLLRARRGSVHAERHRGGRRSRYIVGGPGWSGGVHDAWGRVLWAAAVPPRALRLPVVVGLRPVDRRPPGWSARSGERVHWSPVLRVTVSSEPPQGRNAARIRVRCRVRGGSSYSRTGTPLCRPRPPECFPRSPPASHILPPPAPPRRPREHTPEWRSFQRLCCRAPRATARPPNGPGPQCPRERPRRAQTPRPSMTSAAGSAASSSPGTKSFEARMPDPMQLHPVAQRESMSRRH